jgi:hypothetical protein
VVVTVEKTNTIMTPQKFQEIKRACDTGTGYTLWDLRLLVEEVERLRAMLLFAEKRLANIDNPPEVS